uniref:Death domain-containing protein n=1 Tax=Piliocolobus tephrosceles TaxID=591936 RepID=A0A8C9GJM3_9PRIM
MLHNSSHSKGLAYVGKILRRQERDREGVWVGAGGALYPNTSPFLLEPPVSQAALSVYCTLLATVVLGLLAYVAFKCWRSHKQRQQLAKDQMHRDSSIFLDSPSSLEPYASNQGPHPELGCQLYLNLPGQHQEKVERLLEVSVETDKGWQGLADHLGYQAEAVEIMAQGQVRAYTLLRNWAIQEGSGATHKVLENALVALGQEDVVQVLGLQAEGCSVT